MHWTSVGPSVPCWWFFISPLSVGLFLSFVLVFVVLFVDLEPALEGCVSLVGGGPDLCFFSLDFP